MAEVQVICGASAVLFVPNGSQLVAYGQLNPGGDWMPMNESTQPTWLACLPLPSSDPVTYVVPTTLPAGAYVLCLTMEPTDAACGPLQVTDGAAETSGS